ncbi:hypothetical protein [Xenorhabdus bharatensis]|uniref:hypothetical protein n=1 Tax=Xenorhabdus bharatensis TaxID=3136256 RepID=UPI0030F37D6C
MRFNNLLKTIVFLLAFSVGSAYTSGICPPGHNTMQGYVGMIVYDSPYIYFTLTNEPNYTINVINPKATNNDEQKNIMLNLLIDARNHDHIVKLDCEDGWAKRLYTYQ